MAQGTMDRSYFLRCWVQKPVRKAKPSPVPASGNSDTGHLDHGHSHRQADCAWDPTVSNQPLWWANVSPLVPHSCAQEEDVPPVPGLGCSATSYGGRGSFSAWSQLVFNETPLQMRWLGFCWQERRQSKGPERLMACAPRQSHSCKVRLVFCNPWTKLQP